MAVRDLLSRLTGSGGEYSAVQQQLGVRFSDPRLLEAALTHSSYANEQGLGSDYERLEFLGDSVVGVLAAEWLFRRHPELAEGRLSELKSYLVSREPLADHARHLGLGQALRLGVGEERSGGRDKSSLLADALEAAVGAVFVDRGLDAARRLMEPLFRRSLESASGAAAAKTRLQELAQARGMSLPVYELVSAEGPDHARRFTVECRLDDFEPAIGAGRTKKVAERRAARTLLRSLEEC